MVVLGEEYRYCWPLVLCATTPSRWFGHRVECVEISDSDYKNYGVPRVAAPGSPVSDLSVVVTD